MANWGRIETVLEGRIAQVKGLQYYRSVTEISEIHTPTADRIRRNIPAWQSGRLKNQKNENFFIPLQDVIFLDIETRGLKYKNQTFLNGIAYYHKKRKTFVFDGLFARDPYEEKAILKSLELIVQSRKGIITFNGAFDLSRLENRFKAHLINWVWPRDKHLDMYHAISPYNKFEGVDGRKLTDYEVAIFRFKRECDDVAGAEIPKAHSKYLRGGNPEPLARVVKHNMLDIITTAALYVYLLRNPDYFNESLLSDLSF